MRHTVNGALIRARLEWVRDYASREETIEFFEALPAEVRCQVSILLPAAAYDAGTLAAVDETIVALFGADGRAAIEGPPL